MKTFGLPLHSIFFHGSKPLFLIAGLVVSSEPWRGTRAYSKGNTSQEVYMWGKVDSFPGGGLNDIKVPTKPKWFSESKLKWKSLSFGPFFGAALSAEGNLYLWGSFLDAEKRVFVEPYILETKGKLVDVQCSMDGVFVLSDNGTVYRWTNIDDELRYRNSFLLSEECKASSIASSSSLGKWVPGKNSHIRPFTTTASQHTEKKSSEASMSSPLFARGVCEKLEGLPIAGYFYGGDKTISMSIGAHHAAFITELGALYCCGDNESGQCGVSPYSERSNDSLKIPKKVLFEEDMKVEKAVCGDRHTVVLNKKGDVYSFGDDNKIQLLLGDTRTTSGRVADVSVFNRSSSRPVGPNKTAVQYAQFERHFQSTPSKILNPPTFGRQDSWPKPTDVIAGGEFTLLKYRDSPEWFTKENESNCLMCGGENMFGQCGRNLNTQQQTLASVRLPRHSYNEKTSCGTSHCITALSSGKLYTWGFNKHGQAGTGGPVLAHPPSKLKFPIQQAAAPSSSMEVIEASQPPTQLNQSGDSLSKALNVDFLVCKFDNSAVVLCV